MAVQQASPHAIVQAYFAERTIKARGAYARTARQFGCSDQHVANLVKDFEARPIVVDLAYEPAPGELDYQRARERHAKELQATEQQALLRQLLAEQPAAEMPNVAENANDAPAASQTLVGCSFANPADYIWQIAPFTNIHRCPNVRFANTPICPRCIEHFGPLTVLLTCQALALSAAVAATWHAHHAPLLTGILFTLTVPLLDLARLLLSAWLDTAWPEWRWWLSVAGVAIGAVVLGWGMSRL